MQTIEFIKCNKNNMLSVVSNSAVFFFFLFFNKFICSFTTMDDGIWQFYLSRFAEKVHQWKKNTHTSLMSWDCNIITLNYRTKSMWMMMDKLFTISIYFSWRPPSIWSFHNITYFVNLGFFYQSLMLIYILIKIGPHIFQWNENLLTKSSMQI